MIIEIKSQVELTIHNKFNTKQLDKLIPDGIENLLFLFSTGPQTISGDTLMFTASFHCIFTMRKFEKFWCATSSDWLTAKLLAITIRGLPCTA